MVNKNQVIAIESLEVQNIRKNLPIEKVKTIKKYDRNQLQILKILKDTMD
jgi:hypothetical protein